MIKVLVTGGAGFIGGYVCRYLRSLELEVYNFDLIGQNDEHHICASILDYNAVKKAVETTDVVLHFAGFSNINHVKAAPKKCIELNIMGSTNILEAIREKSSGRFIFASSVYVHNKQGHFYTASKLASELICESYNRLYGIPVAVLRLGTVYGEKSRHEDVVSIFARKAVSGEPLTVYGGGKQIRHFIHGEDIAAACAKLVLGNNLNGTFILSARRGISIKQLADITKQYVDNVIVQNIEDSGREDDYQGDLGESSMIEDTYKKLQWEPTIDIDTGLKRLIRYFKGETG